jgi:hypothetical protein
MTMRKTTKRDESPVHCMDVAEHWERVANSVSKAWRHSGEALAAARLTLRTRMLQLDSKLAQEPVFGELVPLQSCDFFWVLFLTDGAPASDAWRAKWSEESGLKELQLPDLYVVLAAVELEIAGMALSQHINLCNTGGDIGEAMHVLACAASSLTSAEIALSRLDKHGVHESKKACH